MSYKKGLYSGIPIFLGYFPVSFAFGVIAVQNGLTWVQALLISLLNLTSAGQYAGLSIISGGGSLIEIALSQLVINSRYSLMSISLSQKLEKEFTLPCRLLYGFAVTDEVFAVASSNKTVGRVYFAGLTLLPYLGWSLGTLSGAILGGALPQSILSALGVALYGMFIAVVIPEARKEKGVLLVSALAVAISCLLTYAPVLRNISSGFAVIICTITAAAIGAWLFSGEEAAE